ncbi:Metallo-dependent phosphatase-like protein [Radiomyces spectabilis]|uniref:Metallo-dependent phosphatase-like protein n=1 Tax=Radiomyces spectabilis TaxID=64574 RepID=UPI0022210022|nr:Metallo-dependent phosphatase-like protein [Radiomyces spectabilis]KAI8377689.1 Metallo-dependent phosphatase-like protein [Radiomyces spectabilis]
MSTDADENTMKILVATDNHVGYLEDDPVRGQDSFRAFEEVLQMAQRHEVDFIILGGDLFHHNKPSRSCLYTTLKLLRRYCMGNKPSKIFIASDQSLNFSDEFCIANYLDDNYNISYPIFSIHGNHDDPSGAGNLCALNVLSVSGLMNYFGRCHNLNDLTLYPILMQKGTTRLALYGLGNVRDERLHRAWRDHLVKFVRPLDEEWQEAFNIFVLHQNRAAHGPTSHIPEEFLDGFLDLVIWGHEHECRINPEASEACDITQPGSSVATSLSEGEAVPKHIGLLRITGKEYTMEKLRLANVRPFQYTSIDLTSVPDLRVSDAKACQAYFVRVVEDLMNRAKAEWEEQQQQARQASASESLPHPRIEPMPLPLIRVRVQYGDGFETFNAHSFGQKFAGRVANPKDILKFQRIRATTSSQRQKATDILKDLSSMIPERLDRLKVEDLVGELLKDLSLLPENELQDTVKAFVEKDDHKAITQFVEKALNRAQTSSVPEEMTDLTDDFVKRRAAATKQSRVQAYANEQSGRRRRTSDASDTDLSNKRPRIGSSS